MSEKPWRMLAYPDQKDWANCMERRYSSRASAVRAANKLRAKQIVAIVEHENAKLPSGHWRG